MDSKKTGVFMLDQKYSFSEEDPPLLIVGNTVELICDGPAIVKEVIVLSKHVLYYLEKIVS